MKRLLRLLVIAAGGVIVSCSNVAEDLFSVSPKSLKFSAELDSPAPPSQTIKIEANNAYTIAPNITASGSAIVTNEPASCLGYSTSNLKCSWERSLTPINIPIAATWPSDFAGRRMVSLDAEGKMIVGGWDVLNDHGDGYILHATLPDYPDALAVAPDCKTVYAYFFESAIVRPYDIASSNVTPGPPVSG